MHVLYVHQNFPAQFGHIAKHLVEKLNWRCTFVSETPEGNVGGIEKVQYKIAGGATKHNHFCSRTFENTVWHSDGVFNALRFLGGVFGVALAVWVFGQAGAALEADAFSAGFSRAMNALALVSLLAGAAALGLPSLRPSGVSTAQLTKESSR